MPIKMNMESKLTILNLIKTNKDVLFGKLSNELTHEDKINKWKEINELLVSFGITNRDWKYLRDTTWQNWRKRTVEKRANRIRTGADKGKKFSFDEAEEIILSIIGYDNASLTGLGVPESSGTSDPGCDKPAWDSHPAPQRELSSNFNQRRKRKLSSADMEENLKIQILETELELCKEKVLFARRERYKLELELLKMERELNLPPSEFTVDLTCDVTIDKYE